jgi:hypothetical protein
LNETQITPGALPTLARFPELKHLDLRNTRVKEADLDGFKQQRPSVNVICEWVTL